MGEKVDDDDNGNMVAMLLHLPHHLYHVMNGFGGMGKVTGQTSKSGDKLGKVMTRKRVTQWPYCHVLCIIVIMDQGGSKSSFRTLIHLSSA